MNSQILTLTSVKSARLDGAGGAMAMITKDDVNAACAGADPIGMAILQRQVNGILQDRSYRALYQKIIELAVKNGWQTKPEDRGKRMFERLLQLALTVYCSPKRCTGCHGTGVNTRFRQCGKCGGGGVIDYSDRELAEAMGVNLRIWHKVWRKRLSQVSELLRATLPDHETQALRHLLRRLS